jgi:hypothetical protein
MQVGRLYDSETRNFCIAEIFSIRSDIVMPYIDTLLNLPDVRNDALRELGQHDTEQNNAALERLLVPGVDAQTFRIVTGYLINHRRFLPLDILHRLAISPDKDMRLAIRAYVLRIMQSLDLGIIADQKIDPDPDIQKATKAIFDLLEPSLKQSPTGNGF